MLGKTAIVLTLSSYSQTVEPNASSITVTAYADGVAITDGTSSMLTYDGSKITSCSINSSGVITMSYNSNTSTSSTKSGWMKFTYQGQTKQFNLTQRADYVTRTTTSSTHTSSSKTVTSYSTTISDANVADRDCKQYGYYTGFWLTNCTGYTTTTYYHYVNTYYASGNHTRATVTDSTGRTDNVIMTVFFVNTNLYYSGSLPSVGSTYSGTFYASYAWGGNVDYSKSATASITVTSVNSSKYEGTSDVTATIQGNTISASGQYTEFSCPG